MPPTPSPASPPPADLAHARLRTIVEAGAAFADVVSPLSVHSQVFDVPVDEFEIARGIAGAEDRDRSVELRIGNLTLDLFAGTHTRVLVPPPAPAEQLLGHYEAAVVRAEKYRRMYEVEHEARVRGDKSWGMLRGGVIPVLERHLTTELRGVVAEADAIRARVQ